MNSVRINTQLGSMLLAESPAGLAGAWFLDQGYFPTEAESWVPRRSQLLTRAEEQIKAYLFKELKDFDLPLAPSGTAFQRTVWEQLRAIPHGQISSYGRIAAMMSRPSAARAVGMAVGRNPLSLIVPCHRVLAGNGALAGFAGGLKRKRWLLQMEQGVCA